jgi:hypothetical protein
MLNSHPLITVPPECGFMLWLADRFAGRLPGPGLYWNYAEAVSKTRKFHTWGIDTDTLYAALAESGAKSYPAMAAQVVVAYGRAQGKKPERVGDKNNFYMGHLEKLVEVFPESQLIAIVRDGRDVACSYRRLAGLASRSPYKPRLPIDIGQIAHEWQRNVTAIMALPKHVIKVRYEDLVSRPIGTLSRVCAGLGLDYHPYMLAYAANNDEPADTMDWKRATLGTLDNGRMGRHLNELTEAERHGFESIAGEGLRVFGYV